MSTFLSLLFRLSLIGLGLALFLPDITALLYGSAALAGLSLTALVWIALTGRGAKPSKNDPATKDFMLVDGSNVMHWHEGTPKIETVLQVVRLLQDKGYTPGVLFDANAGYLLTGRYRHDGFFGAALDLPDSHVLVVPKGTQADPLLLEAARDFGGRIVSNDQFRDWADSFPEVKTPGHVVKGGYRRGALWLNLPKVAASDALATQ